MANSRRDFLKRSAMAVVAVGIPMELSKVVLARSAGFAIPSQSLTDPLSYLKRSSFEPYINSIFQLRSGPLSAALNLIQVSGKMIRARPVKGVKTSTTMVRDTESEDRFSLLFKSSDSLPQDVYSVSHSALGQFRILVVPVVNRDKTAYYYEAIINRLL